MTFQNNFVAVIKSAGKILKEDRSSEAPTVYIPFGSEYSILLKNLFSRKALVKVTIDGEDALNGRSLIIDANKEIELERFLKDSMNKGNRFKFIEKTEQISNHRGDRVDDGIIRIEYQFERQYAANPCYWTTNYISPSIGGIGSSQNVFYSSSLNNISCNVDGNVYGSLTSNNRSINDDGITVPGSVSNQTFTQGYIGLVEDQKHVITLMIRGKSKDKQIKINTPITVAPVYCHTCGKKHKGNAKFCSNCGTALKVF